MVLLMADHLGVNDIPKAKSLENNDRSTALPVNDAGTSPHICAETVPASPGQPKGSLSMFTNAQIRDLLKAVTERFPNDEAIAGRVRLIEQHLHRRPGGDTRPELEQQMRATLKDLADLLGGGGAASTRTE
jgi:hypothetical protein